LRIEWWEPDGRAAKPMALKFKFKTKDEIPAEHLPLYAEREGAWVLDVDGAVEKSKLDEFRNTNVSLIKERDDLKKRYEGIDPDAVKAMADEKRQLEEEKLLNGSPHPNPLPSAEREKIEKVVENRIKGVKADLEKQIATLSGERDALMKGSVRQSIIAGRTFMMHSLPTSSSFPAPRGPARLHPPHCLVHSIMVAHQHPGMDPPPRPAPGLPQRSQPHFRPPSSARIACP